MKKFFYLTLSAFIFAVGISAFIDPNNLAPGGFSGISILLNRLTGIQTGFWLLFLNIPVMVIGFFKFGKKVMLWSAYCIFATSMMIRLVAYFPSATQNPLLGSVFGSTLVAIGVGLTFRLGATTGGMDIVVKLFRIRYPHMKTGALYMLSDSLVILLSYPVFGNMDAVLYAGIGVVVNSFVLDFVLYGRDEAKFFYIISDKSDTIANRILTEIHISATRIEGEGCYSKESRNILLCVVKKQTAPKIEQIVKEEDINSFLIITKATEIYGLGYKNILEEKI